MANQDAIDSADLHLLTPGPDCNPTARSHEVRTPLNAVIGAATLLASEQDRLTQEQSNLIDILDSGATQITVIIDDLLLLNELEVAGSFKVNLARIDVMRQVGENPPQPEQASPPHYQSLH